jgi:hypothetical protein
LTDGEAGELAMAQRKRGGIAAAIMNAMPEFEKNAAIERPPWKSSKPGSRRR